MNQAVIVWLILCLIWGSTWLFIKLGLRDLPPITFAAMRFIIAAVILWAYVAYKRKSVPTKMRDWIIIAWTGFLAFFVNYSLVFWGETQITSGLTAVIQAMLPAFGMIFAHFILQDEKITVRKVAGIVVGIIGTAIIFYDQMTMEGMGALWGSIAITISAVSMSYSNVLVKAHCKHIDPASLAAGQMSIGVIPLLLIGAVWEGNPLSFNWSLDAVMCVLYLALIGSSLAFMMYYWLIKKVDVSWAMLISLVTPIVALLIGALFLDEKVTWKISVGTLAILSGLALVMKKKKLNLVES